MGLKIFFRRSLLLGISMFAVVPVLVLAASPPWESGRQRGELFVATSADDAALRRRIAACSPTVSPDDARRVVYTAYMTGLEVRRQWRLVCLPGGQNGRVSIGPRTAGRDCTW